MAWRSLHTQVQAYTLTFLVNGVPQLLRYGKRVVVHAGCKREMAVSRLSGSAGTLWRAARQFEPMQPVESSLTTRMAMCLGDRIERARSPAQSRTIQPAMDAALNKGRVISRVDSRSKVAKGVQTNFQSAAATDGTECT